MNKLMIAITVLTSILWTDISANIHLNFIIDENYLVGHTLSSTSKECFSSKEFQEDIIAFQNDAWTADETSYRLLPSPSKMFPELYSHEQLKVFMELAKSLPSFQPILLQTKLFKEKCEKEWLDLYDLTKDYVESLTGIEFTQSFDVFLTHPSLSNGSNIGSHRICWGCQGNFEHYSVVYLWHEILHSYFPNDDLAHCVIQLISDNYLRLFLNPNEQLFPLIGHPHLNPLMEEILPKWEQYLQKNERDIFLFLKELN